MGKIKRKKVRLLVPGEGTFGTKNLCLEPEFMNALQYIAKAKATNVQILVYNIQDKLRPLHPEYNLSSLVRVYIIQWFRQQHSRLMFAVKIRDDLSIPSPGDDDELVDPFNTE